ncbi:hypothetical protein N7448_009451 [Penicillium atrosanguineum]|uniref:Uncharacterized protein n=1 Tax=Penicillium atrosanguineum TaxID=1132637 RepID=A0A9W9PZT3_9EURO|nr:uncharacterized protein N7443_006701 [Penicillium atrosanguineum]KAJ5123354.1 hypothetical protein N7448_009451 [Penicillium atrosanguineum]KAJ5141985.1 hypothetical protein N7526_002980 [Penicillium atrosanguineum]KAJ5298581.1 hypothetical protein N7443_006701 [Penicillium atrosanguineum]KAJ5321154.1 hypothetical protein N7476_004156 [Penicillium atrosanguineum]
MSSFNNFQNMLDQQVGSLPKRSWPAPDNPKKQQRPIPASSLRVQGAAWATAGGGMAATLNGAYRIFRNFRGFKYI